MSDKGIVLLSDEAPIAELDELRPLIAEGLEASKQWIGAAIDLQTALHADYVLANGPIEPASNASRS